MIETTFLPHMDITRRDFVCISFAVAVHSLLFLWKGGILTMPNKQPLGDAVVQVDFMTEVPSWNENEATGGKSGSTGTLLTRLKSVFKHQEAKAPAPAAEPSGKIDVAQPAWTKTQAQLANKEFEKKIGFNGAAEKQFQMPIANANSKEIALKPSQGESQVAAANLKQKSFSVASKDMPFKISQPKQMDALANTNAIPMPVGRRTSDNIKSFDGGTGAGPALQSRTMASKGSFAGLPNSSAGGSSSGSGSAGLAMGGGRGTGAIDAGSGLGTGSGAGAGDGGGYGTGNGTGFGSGTGTGSHGGGRSWAGGSGIPGGASEMKALPRNVISEPTAPATKSFSKGSDMSITGQLANRPVVSRVKPKYEEDGRVALKFRVDWAGVVLDGIVVVLSSGNPSFDQKVIAALKQWVFSKLPPERANEIQEGVITFTFRGV